MEPVSEMHQKKKKKKLYQMTRLISWDTSSESASQIERIFKANNDTKDIQTNENDHRVKNYGINKRKLLFGRCTDNRTEF